MKIVRIRIRRGDHTKGEPQMVYPAGYDPYEVDRQGPGALGIPYGYTGGIGLGAAEESLFIALDDETADRYAQDPDMELVQAAVAEAEIEAARVSQGLPSEIVDDPYRIQAISAKRAAGLELSAEDLDALDPAKPVRGIRTYRKAGDVLATSETVRARPSGRIA